MAKIIRTICMSKEMDDKVSVMLKEGFNFSSWVEENFSKEFMNKEHTEKKIIDYQNKVEELKKSVLQQQEKFENISEEEKKFILEVPSLIKKGFELVALKNRFNVEFSKDLSLKDFKVLINKYRGKHGL